MRTTSMCDENFFWYAQIGNIVVFKVCLLAETHKPNTANNLMFPNLKEIGKTLGSGGVESKEVARKMGWHAHLS